MSIRNKHGPDNAALALRHLLTARLPGAVTTHNAANWCTAPARLDGPYTITAGHTTLKAALYGTDEQTVTFPTGTRTATELVSYFTCDYIGAEVHCSDALAIISQSAGEGTITIGAGTANDILGFTEGDIFSYLPLRSPACYLVQHRSYDGVIPAYPAITILVDSGEYHHDLEMCSYNIKLRIYETYGVDTQDGMSGTVLDGIMRYVSVISDLLRTTTYASAGGQVNAIDLHSVNISPTLEDSNGLVRAWAELALRIVVQETI